MTWRARALNGELVLESTPTADKQTAGVADGESDGPGGSKGVRVIEVHGCRFRWSGAAALLARGM